MADTGVVVCDGWLDIVVVELGGGGYVSVYGM